MYINEIVGAFRLDICGYVHQEVLSLTCMWHTACIRYGLILIGTGNTVVTEVAAAAALNYLVYKQTGPITRDNDVVDTLWQVLMYSDYWTSNKYCRIIYPMFPIIGVDTDYIR